MRLSYKPDDQYNKQGSNMFINQINAINMQFQPTI